jgi:hypothetical protein
MGYKSRPTVTRPANTTAYTAGDVVGGVITFTNAGPFGGSAIIVSAALQIDIAAIPTGMTSFTLHLYDTTPPSAIADNSPWNLPSGDQPFYLGNIALGSPAAMGATPATLWTQADAVLKEINLVADRNVYAYLVTSGGFTPAGNSEVYLPILQSVDG